MYIYIKDDGTIYIYIYIFKNIKEIPNRSSKYISINTNNNDIINQSGSNNNNFISFEHPNYYKIIGIKSDIYTGWILLQNGHPSMDYNI